MNALLTWTLYGNTVIDNMSVIFQFAISIKVKLVHFHQTLASQTSIKNFTLVAEANFRNKLKQTKISVQNICTLFSEVVNRWDDFRFIVIEDNLRNNHQKV